MSRTVTIVNPIRSKYISRRKADILVEEKKSARWVGPDSIEIIEDEKRERILKAVSDHERNATDGYDRLECGFAWRVGVSASYSVVKAER